MNGVADFKRGDIHADFFRNIRGHAFHIEKFSRMTEHAALVLYANGNSDQFNRYFDRNFFVHGNMLKINMNYFASIENIAVRSWEFLAVKSLTFVKACGGLLPDRIK